MKHSMDPKFRGHCSLEEVAVFLVFRMESQTEKAVLPIGRYR